LGNKKDHIKSYSTSLENNIPTHNVRKNEMHQPLIRTATSDLIIFQMTNAKKRKCENDVQVGSNSSAYFYGTDCVDS